ncbi:MAG: deoxyguanosinetriphosphate triphosphohydrolase family protein [Promethearchaeota archaeon]
MDEKRIEFFKSRLSRDSEIGERGTHNSQATRYFKEIEDKEYDDIRPPFFRDVDRIVHSKAYARYIDKSQVFYGINNANISHRSLHVVIVSRVARQIGRIFKLNTDLIEAIALGHDIGHTFASHLGENILDEYSKKYGLGRFQHNAQGIRWLTRLEKRFPEQPAKGLNLTLQVLDGILCHDGEVDERILKPLNKNKTWADHFAEYEDCFNENKITRIPMTYEGIVVRFADVIAYIGRDIEDAILLDIIERSEIPEKPRKILGDTNRQIMNNLIMDLINYSYDKDVIGYSEPVFEALKELKTFNYKNIYLPKDEAFKSEITKEFALIFRKSLKALEEEDYEAPIFKDHVEYIDDENNSTYYKTLKDANKLVLIVRDYIAGMSDKYFNEIYKVLSNS